MIDLDRVASRLSLPVDRGTDADGAPSDGSPRLHAAVSVVLRPSDAGPELLLIKRAAAERDPWSGQIAFPGGKHESGDAHLLDTARRETLEETGLVLPDAPPEWVGRLPGVSPRGRGSDRLPPLLVTPFLFRVEAGAAAHVASREVERIHWVSLSALADPAQAGVYRLPIGDAFRSFPSIEFGGEVVWGLTWRVLDGLLAGLGFPRSAE